MRRALLYVITVYASAPVVLYLFPWILGHIVFSHLLRFPFFVDLSRPELVLNHTCNFYLNTDEGVSTLFVCHEAAGKRPEWYRETLKDGNPVIIYLHGNLGTRWDESSIEVILSAAGYHVLSLDYRGFGDSTGEPSEAGLTSDALYLYHWVKVHSRGGLVCLWGHSLGTGVATNTAVKLQEQGGTCFGTYWIGTTLNLLMMKSEHSHQRPSLAAFCSAVCDRDMFHLNTSSLKTVTSPLLILHAEDDNILYQISLQARKKTETDAQVEMISYSTRRGFSHNDIYLDPNLSDAVG
uniref:AB hydrolase-1 domain-containing protein n=1 Tax=Takifugu rubripes TaxID=31033 RepID=H2T920_TAKRU